MQLIIDTDKISQLVEKSGEIMLSNEGEEYLVKLLKLQEQVEEAVKQAKKAIEDSALAISPNFKSITSDSVKISYRAYGARFKIDESYIGEIPRHLYETKTTYSVNTKEVEKYAEEHGLPRGIVEPERQPQISIKLKEVENA